MASMRSQALADAGSAMQAHKHAIEVSRHDWQVSTGLLRVVSSAGLQLF